MIKVLITIQLILILIGLKMAFDFRKELKKDINKRSV